MFAFSGSSCPIYVVRMLSPSSHRRGSRFSLALTNVIWKQVRYSAGQAHVDGDAQQFLLGQGHFHARQL